MSTNQSETRHLRPEARPYSWNYLDQEQKRAFEKIVDHLYDAVTHLPEPSEPQGQRSAPNWLLPREFDEDRASRLVLLSGDRGTGKTSVLLSVMKIVSGVKIVAGKEQDKQIMGMPQPLLDQVKNLHERIIWLSPLDMEPLPKPTNLLAAILTRLENAIERVGGDTSMTSPQSFLAPCSAVEKPLKELARLKKDVALTWDGNIQQRAAALDPDVYAEEVLRAEKAKLDLNSRLADLLDSLAKQPACRRVVDNPLFVLPVDDFDLNPLRCLELLQLIRMISVPRLFFIILGDEEVAEQVFDCKIQGDLNSIRKTEFHGNNFIDNFSREIAGKAMIKLLPPAQRIRLRNMTPQEVFNFYYIDKPDQSIVLFLKSMPSLSEASGIINFADFLLVKSWRTLSDAEKEGLPYAYYALRFFEMTIRETFDFWFASRNSIEHPIPSKIDATKDEEMDQDAILRNQEHNTIKFFIKLVYQSIQDSKFYSKFQKELQDFKPHLDENITKFPSFSNILAQVITHGLVSSYTFECPFKTSYYLGWNLQYIDEDGNAITIRPPKIAAALGLLHDLFTFIAPQDLSMATFKNGNTLFQTIWLLNTANEIHNIEEESEDVISASDDLLDEESDGYPKFRQSEKNIPRYQNRTSISIGWSLPPWNTFWESDLFGEIWNYAQQQVRQILKSSEAKLEKIFEYFICIWITAGASIIRGQKLSNEWSRLNSAGETTDINWDNIIAQEIVPFMHAKIQLKLSSRQSSNDRFDQWIAQIAHLLAPERRAPIHVTECFLKNQLIKTFWKQESEKIRDMRRITFHRYYRNSEWEFGLLLVAPQVFVRQIGIILTKINLMTLFDLIDGAVSSFPTTEFQKILNVLKLPESDIADIAKYPENQQVEIKNVLTILTTQSLDNNDVTYFNRTVSLWQKRLTQKNITLKPMFANDRNYDKINNFFAFLQRCPALFEQYGKFMSRHPMNQLQELCPTKAHMDKMLRPSLAEIWYWIK